MSKRTQSGWVILILLMASFALTACVRPYPGSEAAAAMPTIDPIATQPIVEPPALAATPDTGQPTSEPAEVQEPTPVAIEPTAEPATETTYIVVAGDTLFKIALEHNVTVDEIAAANGIIDIDSLEVGQELIIPAPGSTVSESSGATDQELVEQGQTEASGEAQTDADTSEATDGAAEAGPAEPATAPGGVHVIQPGENLFRIGLRYGCTVEQLARHNSITTPNRVPVGLELQIPDCN